MKSYISRFSELYSNLQSTESVEILHLKPSSQDNLNLQKITLDYLNKEFEYNLKEEFIEYMSVSGSQLRYIYSSKKLNVGGEFSLTQIADALILKVAPTVFIQKTSAPDIELLKTFRIIDDHPFSGDFKMSVFSLKEGYSPPNEPEIYFYDRGSYFSMNVDYGGYLDALLEMAAISNWQYLFCEVDWNARTNYDLKQTLKTGLQFLEIIFPNNNYEKYRKVLN